MPMPWFSYSISLSGLRILMEEASPLGVAQGGEFGDRIVKTCSSERLSAPPHN
jgi:hypothetical protein